MNIGEAMELDKSRRFAWDGVNKDTLDAEQAFQQGFEAGYVRGRTRTTIELANEYNGNGYPHSWFPPLNWYRSRKRVRAFLDQLWQEYGPTYEEDEEEL